MCHFIESEYNSFPDFLPNGKLGFCVEPCRAVRPLSELATRTLKNEKQMGLGRWPKCLFLFEHFLECEFRGCDD